MSFEFQTLHHIPVSVNTTVLKGRVRTVTSSVILRTSFPSEDLHLTLYRVFRNPSVQRSIFIRLRACASNRDGARIG